VHEHVDVRGELAWWLRAEVELHVLDPRGVRSRARPEGRRGYDVGRHDLAAPRERPHDREAEEARSARDERLHVRIA
jgi:hypothetical protein